MSPSSAIASVESQANQPIHHEAHGFTVAQRADDGYFNGTAMCLAMGKQFNDWRRLKGTREFLEALSGSTGIPVDLLIRTVATGPNDVRGTWVNSTAAINLAQWGNAEFAVACYRWLLEWFEGSDQRFLALSASNSPSRLRRSNS